MPKYTLNYIEKAQVNKANELRWELQKLGSENHPWLTDTYAKAIDNLNKWLNSRLKVQEPIKIGQTVLLTINSGQWLRLQRAKTMAQIREVLDKHMGQYTEFTGGTLWQFAETRRTTAQIASGIALADWSNDTIRALFQLDEKDWASYFEGVAETHRG